MCMLNRGRTCSFHSTTHFSIQGIKLITKNSLENRAVCCISFSVIIKVLIPIAGDVPEFAGVGVGW
jgi:hypothetical protein